jgi:hypothetical protein
MLATPLTSKRNGRANTRTVSGFEKRVESIVGGEESGYG